jgi:uncharacterized protein YdeI (YjbR/CyaY-like superfamily)
MVSGMKTCDARTQAEWRRWLADHHAAESEVWLIFHKRHTDVPSVAYEDAVNEALCYGWVDSLIKRIDDDRYARKFTPRTEDSKWSTINRQRYARLLAAGRLAPAGVRRPPTARSGDAPRPQGTPDYLVKALRKVPAAWKSFEGLPPSHKRNYIAWIDSAKKEETKIGRIEKAIAMLLAGKRLGI